MRPFLQAHLFAIALILPLVTAWQIPPPACFTDNPTTVNVSSELDALLNGDNSYLVNCQVLGPWTFGQSATYTVILNRSHADNHWLAPTCTYVFEAILSFDSRPNARKATNVWNSDVENGIHDLANQCPFGGVICTANSIGHKGNIWLVSTEQDAPNTPPPPSWWA